jgi:hypothetical protein
MVAVALMYFDDRHTSQLTNALQEVFYVWRWQWHQLCKEGKGMDGLLQLV